MNNQVFKAIGPKMNCLCGKEVKVKLWFNYPEGCIRTNQTVSEIIVFGMCECGNVFVDKCSNINYKYSFKLDFVDNKDCQWTEELKQEFTNDVVELASRMYFKYKHTGPARLKNRPLNVDNNLEIIK